VAAAGTHGWAGEVRGACHLEGGNLSRESVIGVRGQQRAVAEQNGCWAGGLQGSTSKGVGAVPRLRLEPDKHIVLQSFQATCVSGVPLLCMGHAGQNTPAWSETVKVM
jgi:hypothetical protein